MGDETGDTEEVRGSCTVKTIMVSGIETRKRSKARSFFIPYFFSNNSTLTITSINNKFSGRHEEIEI